MLRLARLSFLSICVICGICGSLFSAEPPNVAESIVAVPCLVPLLATAIPPMPLLAAFRTSVSFWKVDRPAMYAESSSQEPSSPPPSRQARTAEGWCLFNSAQRGVVGRPGGTNHP